MIQVLILLANGFEEAEALVPADLLIRAGADVRLVSLEGDGLVTGSHGFRVMPDCAVGEADVSSARCLFLPGGKAGTERLSESEDVRRMLKTAEQNGILIAAICAAPSVLGKYGFLNGRRYTCYPGFEQVVAGGIKTDKKVELDDIFLTGEGMGVAQEFGFAMVRYLFGEQTEKELRQKTRS